MYSDFNKIVEVNLFYYRTDTGYEGLVIINQYG